MKEIESFLEGADAKEKGVKSDADKTKELKAHHAKEMEQLNDKMFIALMDQYKNARRGPDRSAANKILEKAQGMKDVSLKAKIAAAYL